MADDTNLKNLNQEDLGEDPANPQASYGAQQAAPVVQSTVQNVAQNAAQDTDNYHQAMAAYMQGDPSLMQQWASGKAMNAATMGSLEGPGEGVLKGMPTNTLENAQAIQNTRGISQIEQAAGTQAANRAIALQQANKANAAAAKAAKIQKLRGYDNGGTVIGGNGDPIIGEDPANPQYSYGAQQTAPILQDTLTNMKASQAEEYAKNPGMRYMDMALGTLPYEGAAEEAKSAAKGLTEAVAKRLKTNDFSIMTAENPLGKQLPSLKNKQIMDSFYKQLEENNIPYEKVEGSYGPTKENSVIIPHTKNSTVSKIESLAKQYGQESVLHKIGDENTLKYLTGDQAGKKIIGKGLNIDPDLKENYTRVGDTKFSANLDFENPKNAELVHYSKGQEPLSSISPDFHGTGQTGAESSRTGRIPRSYFYETETPPESHILSGAKYANYINKPNNIVDLASDEVKPFIEQAKNSASNPTDMFNNLEKILKDNGYSGYKNSNSALPNAIAIFGKTKPIRNEPIDFKHMTKIKNYAGGGTIAPPAGLDEFLNSAPTYQPESAQQDTAPPGLNEFIAPEMSEEAHTTLGQKGLAAIEGAGRGATGPLVSGLETKVFGVNPEDIQARREYNPVESGAGEAAGFVGSLLATKGVGALTVGAEHAIAPIAAELGLGKIGSAAAKAAVGGATYQAMNEADKMFLNEPDATAENAIQNIGLASLIGLGFGAGTGLWQAGFGSKAGGTLKAIANKMGGIEGQGADAVGQTIKASGLDLPPEVQARLTASPKYQQMFDDLIQTDHTASGKELQKTYDTFKKQTGDLMSETLGRDPEAISNSDKLSPYESGKNIGNTLSREYAAQVDPLSQRFEDFKGKFKNNELPVDVKAPDGVTIPGTVSKASDAISKLASEQGWMASPSSDIMKIVNNVQKELPLQKTVKNLGDYITQLNEKASSNPFDKSLQHNIGQITKVLRGAQEDVIGASLGAKEGPQAVQAYQDLRAQYGQKAALKNELEDRLHLRASTGGYAKALREAASGDGEAILRKLSGKNDASLLPFLQKNFPATAEALKGYHIDNLLKNASEKALNGHNINSEALLKGINAMSPELRDFVIPKEVQPQIQAIGDVLKGLKNPAHNFSNSGRVIKGALDKMSGGISGLVGAVIGHGGPGGYLLGHIGHAIGKDAPDAIRLAMLKWIGKGQPIDSVAFKHSVDVAEHALKGEAALSKATTNVFKKDSQVLPDNVIPIDRDRVKLERSLKNLDKEPEKLLNVAGRSGYYMPEHATAIGKIASSAVNYLQAQRPPENTRDNPLDTPHKPTPLQLAQYNRTLDIAVSPMIVLKHIKDGTITPKDIQDQRAMYPALYNRTVQKLTSQMTESVSKGQIIPYKTRLGLSLYMGQPLDSTMTQQAIQSAQPAPSQPNAQQNQPVATRKPSNKSATGMTSMVKGYNTQSQSAERDRTARKER